jgi:hypothetical protein
VAAVLLATGLVVAPAEAAPTWVPSRTVSGDPAPMTGNPKVVLDRFGNATAVWHRDVGGTLQVQASRRPAGGSWSEPVPISDPERFAARPDIGVDSAGTVTVAWLAQGPENQDQVEAVSRPLRGDWSEPGLVAETNYFVGPSLAVDAAGTATVVLLRSASGQYTVRAARRPKGGTWSVAEPISDPSAAIVGPEVAVDPSTGALVAAWQFYDGTNAVVQANRRPAKGSWGEAVRVSEAANDGLTPEVAIDAKGTSTVVWRRYDGGRYEAAVSTALAGGGWSPRELLSPEGETAFDVRVATNPTGRAVVAWNQAADGEPGVARVSTRGAGGTWSQPTPLSDASMSSTAMHAAVSPDGTTHVMWTWNNGTGWSLQTSRKKPGKPWTPAKDIAADAFLGADGSALWAGRTGDVVAAFIPSSASLVSVKVRALDAAGPRITTWQVPRNGLVGRALVTSARAKDAWSSVASYKWKFGDGTSAKGRKVTHSYSRPGTYRVTLKVTDSRGNVSTRSKKVTVRR